MLGEMEPKTDSHIADNEQNLTALRTLLGDEILPPSTVAVSMMTAFGGTDRCLRRYLRDKAGNVEQAAEAIRATILFRAEHDVDNVRAKIEANGVKERVEKVWFSAFCPNTAPGDGSPILYYKVAVVDGGKILAAATEEDIRDFYLYWMEECLVMQANSIADGKDTTGVTEIYDIANVGIRQLHIRAMSVLNRVLGLGQVHYPSNLTKGYLINAPWWISKGYSLVSGVLSEATVSALTISSDNCRDDLLEFMTDQELEAMLDLVGSSQSSLSPDEEEIAQSSPLLDKEEASQSSTSPAKEEAA